MPIYTVHAPVLTNADLAATDRFAFVRDGSILTIDFDGSRLTLIGWIVVVVGLDAAMAALGAGQTAIFWVNVLIALLTGFEAASLRRWTLSRRNWRQFDIVVADDEEAAERRFFDRWAAKQRALSDDQLAVDRGGPPPTRDVPGQAFSRPPAPPQDEIIGLFPEPGGSR